MEKTTNNETLSPILNENLILTNRKILKLEGIKEIISTSETNINLKLKDTSLAINGNEISITRLDVELGILEATGNFESFKYGKSGNLLKRLFKWNAEEHFKKQT